MQPEHHHYHYVNSLPERRRDAFDAQSLTGLSEQPDHRLAQLAQRTRPPAARLCVFDARTGHRLEC